MGRRSSVWVDEREDSGEGGKQPKYTYLSNCQRIFKLKIGHSKNIDWKSISVTSHAAVTRSDRSNLEKEGFILAHTLNLHHGEEGMVLRA